MEQNNNNAEKVAENSIGFVKKNLQMKMLKNSFYFNDYWKSYWVSQNWRK